MNLYENVAKNIRKYWKGSWYRLAKDSGVPYSTLGNIVFNRKKHVILDTAYKIAKALKITLDDLVK